MKKSMVLILIIVFSHTNLNAQVVTNVAPLKPGNKWVYYSYVVFQGSIEKYEVGDTMKEMNGISFYHVLGDGYSTLLDNGFYARHDDSLPDSIYVYFKTNPQIGDKWEQDLALEGSVLYSTIIDTFSASVFDRLTLIYVVDRTDSGVVGSREYWTKEFGLLNGLYEQAEDILKGCVIDGVVYGDTTTVDIIDDDELPTEFILNQNYPNPFNSNTVISWQIAVASDVELKIYDFLGREIETLVNQYYDSGKYEITFQAEGLSSGVYFYKIITDNFSAVNKMIYLK